MQTQIFPTNQTTQSTIKESQMTTPDLLGEVTTILEEGIQSNYSTRFVAEQVFEFTLKHPKLTQNNELKDYQSVKQTVEDYYHSKKVKPAESKNILNDGTIKEKRFTNLEHGSLKKVNAIVLHQTDSSSAKKTLSAYKNQSTGAHFLIDKDGTIYLTAKTDKIAYHVGKVRPRCQIESTCSKDELEKIEKIGFKPKTLHNREKIKKYPERYPTNKDSIGIEVVGEFNSSTGYEAPTAAQTKSLKKLIEALQKKHNLTDADIYKHSTISYKQPSEAQPLVY